MRSFLDTSVLVAAFWGDHVHHALSLNVLAGASGTGSACAAHSLAELFAVLTRLPVKPPIGSNQALLFLQEIRDRLVIVSLDAEAYADTIWAAADRGVKGGRIYDALILACAVRSGAEVIYTWNLKDYRALAPQLEDRIRTPGPPDGR